MSDLLKNFSFDLQRFAEVSYSDIGASSALSEYGFQGTSSIYTSSASASSIDGKYFWGDTQFIDANFGTSSGVFLNVDVETINFTLSGVSDIASTDFDESNLNGTTYTYYSIKDVTAIDFKDVYTVGGTTSKVTSNSADF